MKSYIITLCILALSVSAFAQRQIGLGFITDEKMIGTTKGAEVFFNLPVYELSEKTHLTAGVVYDFKTSSESLVAFSDASIYTNSILLTAGADFKLFASKKFIVQPFLFVGISMRTQVGEFVSSELKILSNHKNTFNYFNRGVGVNVQYAFNEKYRVNAFSKADLYRLTNGDGIADIPDLVYGVGLVRVF